MQKTPEVGSGIIIMYLPQEFSSFGAAIAIAVHSGGRALVPFQLILDKPFPRSPWPLPQDVCVNHWLIKLERHWVLFSGVEDGPVKGVAGGIHDALVAAHLADCLKTQLF